MLTMATPVTQQTRIWREQRQHLLGRSVVLRRAITFCAMAMVFACLMVLCVALADWGGWSWGQIVWVLSTLGLTVVGCLLASLWCFIRDLRLASDEREHGDLQLNFGGEN